MIQIRIFSPTKIIGKTSCVCMSCFVCSTNQINGILVCFSKDGIMVHLLNNYLLALFGLCIFLKQWSKGTFCSHWNRYYSCIGCLVNRIKMNTSWVTAMCTYPSVDPYCVVVPTSTHVSQMQLDMWLRWSLTRVHHSWSYLLITFCISHLLLCEDVIYITAWKWPFHRKDKNIHFHSPVE